jgi:hypothetical protein
MHADGVHHVHEEGVHHSHPHLAADEEADEKFAKAAAAHSAVAGIAWDGEGGFMAWWVARKADQMAPPPTKAEVLAHIDPVKVPDTPGSSYGELVAGVGGAGAGGPPRSWAESVVTSISKWWASGADLAETLSFQLKTMKWGTTKWGVNGYTLAWLDYAKTHPPKEGQLPGPAQGVPDAAPAADAAPAGSFPDGIDGPGAQVVVTGWRRVYNMIRAQAKNYGTDDHARR